MKFSQIEVYINNTLDANLVVTNDTARIIDIPYRYPWNVRIAIHKFACGESKNTTCNLPGQKSYRWNWK